jgi:prepilin-type N-terminal cleavage/methylation domain-containing protein
MVINYRKTYNAGQEQGFTLLELLVALVILGLALGLVSGAVSDSLTRTERMRAQTSAAVLASNVLERLGNDTPLKFGATRGTQPPFSWTLTITPAAGHFILPLDKIDLRIAGPSGHSIGHWQTLRLAPQPHP